MEAGDSFGEDEDNSNWDSEDEQEIDSVTAMSSSTLKLAGRKVVLHSGVEASSSACSSGCKLIDHFIGMGFPVKAVAEAIREYGEENSDLILEVLLKDPAELSKDSAVSNGSGLIDHFVGMGFSKEMVEKVIQEHGDCNKTDSILETLLTYSASSSACSSRCKLIDHFIGMGFPVKAVAEAIREYGEENSGLILEVLLKDPAELSEDSAGFNGSGLIDHFVGMGFSKEMVEKVIQEHGDCNKMDSILETLLTYLEIEKNPQKQSPIDSDHSSSDYKRSFLDDFFDLEDSENEAFFELESDEELQGPLVALTRMGYREDEAAIALDRCGREASISVLADFISAARMAKEDNVLYPDDRKPRHVGDHSKFKKRSLYHSDMLKKSKMPKLEKKILTEEDEPLHLPNPMIGFGVPTERGVLTQRHLPEAAKGSPFFYYENVALAPKGVWQTISRCLYDVEPEFVDSKYFCSAARKRGYVHNLPIHNRFPLLPLQKLTIQDALPLTRKCWPAWDPRTQLNCLQTCVGSAKLTERIRKAISKHEGEGDPPPRVQQYVLYECRKWNLVWVGKNKVAPLEPDEVEMLLGFPKNHTRGGGISRTERYRSLGNSFQVDTVAYHLSVLKDMFPDGMNVLSLFSGIGGAEVALHKLGIRLNNVVAVEISELNREIMTSWWEQTNQTGNLIHIPDVQQLDASHLEKFMTRFGGFDLVVGGSPCNNLAGSNRHHRNGLEGRESGLFYDYVRILDLVKNMMTRNR